MKGRWTYSGVQQSGRKGTHIFGSAIRADWQLPVEPDLDSLEHNLSGGVSAYTILAKPGNVIVNPARWKDPPHRHYVNLPVASTPESGTEIVDPKSMLAFSRRYGLLSRSSVHHHDFDPSGERDIWVQRVESSESRASLSESISRYGQEELRDLTAAKSQALLRFAWESGDRRALEAIAKCAGENLQCHVGVDDGTLVISAQDVWTLICLLLVRDHAAGKTAICANPDCQAPHFLKSRKDQKTCEAVECVAWAQRQHALKWYRDNRKKNPNLEAE